VKPFAACTVNIGAFGLSASILSRSATRSRHASLGATAVKASTVPARLYFDVKGGTVPGSVVYRDGLGTDKVVWKS
jgi:hypothetical protein